MCVSVTSEITQRPGSCIGEELVRRCIGADVVGKGDQRSWCIRTCTFTTGDDAESTLVLNALFRIHKADKMSGNALVAMYSLTANICYEVVGVVVQEYRPHITAEKVSDSALTIPWQLHALSEKGS